MAKMVAASVYDGHDPNVDMIAVTHGLYTCRREFDSLPSTHSCNARAEEMSHFPTCISTNVPLDVIPKSWFYSKMLSELVLCIPYWGLGLRRAMHTDSGVSFPARCHNGLTLTTPGIFTNELGLDPKVRPSPA